MAEPVTQKVFYVWLIAANDEFADTLVAKLVRRGFIVGPLSRPLVTQQDDVPNVVIAMQMSRTPKTNEEKIKHNPTGIYHELVDVLTKIKAKYMGIVITLSADATWQVGNNSIKAEREEKEIAIKEANKKVN